MVAHERAGEPAVLLHPGGVARRVVGHRVEHGHGRARAALDRGGEADVVEMVMRREQQLDVLDAQPFAAQAGLERRERVVVARPRVDQRDRVAVAAARRSPSRRAPGEGVWRLHASMN